MASVNVVISFSKDILQKDHFLRSIFIDNCYISRLTKLIVRNIHLMERICSNLRDLNKEITKRKLKRGESSAKEHGI
jgi:hypothetical protein